MFNYQHKLHKYANVAEIINAFHRSIKYVWVCKTYLPGVALEKTLKSCQIKQNIYC